MSASLPLEGIRVLEFVHLIMGPTCGLILADLGAEVIKMRMKNRKVFQRNYLSIF